jgi:hypothetical protein
MKPRTAGLVVGILLAGAMLAAYVILVMGVGLKAPSPTRVAVTHSPPPPQPGRAPSPQPTGPPPSSGSQSPQARPPVQGAPQFNEFLRGIALLEEAGQGLNAEQARALLPLLKQFTSEGGDGVGFYNRFPAAQDAIWAALTDKQQDWLKKHKSDIKSQQGPPERTSAAPAEKLLKAIESR